MPSIFEKLLNPLFRRGRGPARVVAVELAPVGYDPLRDPSGEQLRQQHPRRRFEMTLEAGHWVSIVPWALAFLAVVGVAVWWFWFRPANSARKDESATATAIALLPTSTPTATSTPTPTIGDTVLSTPTQIGTGLDIQDTPVVTNTPTSTATDVQSPTSTWTPPPTETPTVIPTFTATWTLPPTETPIWPTATPTPASSASLASGSAIAGENMVVTGRVNNGSIVQVKWGGSGDMLAQVTPRTDGTWAASFVVPAVAAKGYHLIRVEWTGGGIDLVLAISVPTYTPTPFPTWTPFPTPTGTSTPIIPTATPTITPTPFPTPDGGWPFQFFFPFIFNRYSPDPFDSPLGGL